MINLTHYHDQMKIGLTTDMDIVPGRVVHHIIHPIGIKWEHWDDEITVDYTQGWAWSLWIYGDDDYQAGRSDTFTEAKADLEQALSDLASGGSEE